MAVLSAGPLLTVWNAPEVMIGTPRVWFARNAREFTTLSAGESRPPTAGRDFRRTDRLLVRFDTFAPGGVAPVVTARLLNQQGTKMIDVPVTAPPAAGQPYVFDLALASFAHAKTLYQCPMHPQIIREAPGSCPICYMALEKIEEHEHGTDTGTGGQRAAFTLPAARQQMIQR